MSLARIRRARQRPTVGPQNFRIGPTSTATCPAYRLAHDIGGIGFKTTDELAGWLGVDRSSPLRMRAGIAYALQQLTNKGHCAFPRTAWPRSPKA